MTVARYAGDARSVLDVGGRGQEMACLIAGATVTSVNIEPPADRIVAPGLLPFADDSHDAVTSSDVLEHVPAEDRRAHVAELLRVARRRVVLGFPCGSPQKSAAEVRLAATLLDDFGLRLDFLDEHLEHGLPTPNDVAAMDRAAAPRAEVRMLFHDDFEDADRLLLDAVTAYRRHKIRPFLRFAHAWVVRRRPELGQQQLPTTNRVFLVIDLPAPARPGSA